jgi:hypothetical protein
LGSRSSIESRNSKPHNHGKLGVNMSTNPIDGLGSKPIAPLGGSETAAPNTPTAPAKPAVKPPLERPFSLSLPPEKSVAETVVKNIDDSNKETERLTKQTAEEQKLEQIVQEQQALDRELNGPGKGGV